ncbi:MAG TPA: hypothetical protein DDY43_04255 [Synechococcales bacterium UBA10510]|nr:hypothetical protein [Synechococcales bacterium UBA10510]
MALPCCRVDDETNRCWGLAPSWLAKPLPAGLADPDCWLIAPGWLGWLARLERLAAAVSLAP